LPSVRVPKELKTETFFLTFTVHRWYYLFDRHNRWDIIADSLKYCQANKGLTLYNYVFMLNHIHLLAQCSDMSGFIRDFKTYTSKEIRKNIEETEPHILKLFERNGEYHFWQKTNMPEVIRNVDFYLTKAQYVEQNPVRKRYVSKAEDWIYSSANKEKNILKVDSIY
jgi:REP element-mobilizing transposase RayT